MIPDTALLANIIVGSLLFAMMAYAQVRHEIEADPSTPQPAQSKVLTRSHSHDEDRYHPRC